MLGNVGSGKTSLCKRLELEYGYKHLALGDLLREEKNPVIQKCMRDGRLTPSSITTTVLKVLLRV